jgi:solute carrier family 25 carnitine/acylcarnitine transporter 20/29
MDDEEDQTGTSAHTPAPPPPPPPSFPPSPSPSTTVSFVSPSSNSFVWYFAKDLIAGTGGGMAGIVAGQPADTVKVRQQTSLLSPPPASLRIARDMLLKEGPLSFFRGMVAPLIANAPINALIFTVYGGIIRSIEQDNENHANGEVTVFIDDGDVLPEPIKATLLQQLMAGAAGGVAQCVVACPSELIKIQQQIPAPAVAATPLSKTAVATSATTATTAAPPSTLHLARLRVVQSGWRIGLFQGWNATMLRDVPAFGLYFYSYGCFKQLFETLVVEPGVRSDVRIRSGGSWVVDTLPTFMAGGMAGVTSWAFTMPCDVIKSTVQAMPATASAQEKQWLHVARTGVDRNGVAYFFRGAGPAIVRAFPVSAVVFTVYEFCMEFLNGFDGYDPV